MLTTQQLATLKAAILADPVLAAQPMTMGGAYFIANAINVEASPAFVVWKSSVDQASVMGEGFDWARVDNLSAGKARIWDWMFRGGSINPAQSNIRAGIDATWVGTAADLAVRAAVYSACKRNAKVGEQWLATGTGTTASPATMGYEGNISPDDIVMARES